MNITTLFLKSIIILTFLWMTLLPLQATEPQDQEQLKSPRAAFTYYLKLAEQQDWKTLADYYAQELTPEQKTQFVGRFQNPKWSARLMGAFTAALKQEDYSLDPTGKNVHVKFGDNGYTGLVLGEDGIWRFRM
ncbi:MAG: hypothetical protein AAF649_11245 [Verrucomicrobiota bacterium]